MSCSGFYPGWSLPGMKGSVIEMEKLLIQGLKKTFAAPDGTPFHALLDIDLTIRDRDLAVIVGPSGCGKSTLLNIVGGLETAASGDVLVDGRAVTGPGADRGMVFQNDSLVPWLTVRENVQFGLRVKGLPKQEQRDTADRYIELVGLQEFADALPRTLSGGMKQRVAIARTLANSPSILLMDEPFGALDAQTRMVMQELLMDIYRKTSTTILFITHDIDEALLLGSRIFVMSRRPGQIRREIRPEYDATWTHRTLVLPMFTALKQEIMEMLWQDSADAAAGH